MTTESHPESDPKLDTLLSHTLPAVSPADEPHYELDELTQLAAHRQEKGAAWEMPAHLSRCGLCLEAFHAILEGLATVSDDALRRYTGLGQREPKIIAFPWKLAWRVAAAAAVLSVAFLFFTRPAPAHVSGGRAALPDGTAVAPGAAIPRNLTVTASEDLRTKLVDGSTIELTKDSQASFGSTSVTLTTGKLLATVTKQKAGQAFVVKTALGEVVVVGTRFSVTSAPEDVVVYESTAGTTRQRTAVVQAVRVHVFEGVVRVRRQREQVSVIANQTAVLRENEPGIEVQ